MRDESFERYHSFMRGFRAGVTASVRDPAMFENKVAHIRDEYESGFERGTKERRAIHAEVCDRTGYKPTILRAV